MQIEPFKLERYFAQYEFSAPRLLSSSDSQAFTLSEVLALADAETGRLWQELELGYTQSSGHPLLRRAIAGLYRNIAEERILVCAPEEGIFLTLNSLLEAGDHVICTFPGYQSLYQIAENAGCRVTRWQPEEANGWRFNPRFLEEAIRPETRLLVFNFPHNPTGFLPDREDFTRIMQIARERGLYVLADEMYRGLEYDPAERLPAACDEWERAVSLSGMSKAYGLPGVRIGWLATQDGKLLEKFAALKDYTTICSNAPGEILALIALRAEPEVLEKQLARIKRNLGGLDDFMRRQARLIEWERPRAGTIAFPRWKAKDGAAEFCRRAVEEAGIMLLPSTVYDYGDHHFRFGYGRENFPQALAELDQFLTARY